MNEKSYTDLMKKNAMKKKRKKESFVLDLYIDMMLTEILLVAEKEKLTQKINDAIDKRDRKAFQKLSEQFKDLMQQFG